MQDDWTPPRTREEIEAAFAEADRRIREESRWPPRPLVYGPRSQEAMEAYANAWAARGVEPDTIEMPMSTVRAMRRLRLLPPGLSTMDLATPTWGPTPPRPPSMPEPVTVTLHALPRMPLPDIPGPRNRHERRAAVAARRRGTR